MQLPSHQFLNLQEGNLASSVTDRKGEADIVYLPNSASPSLPSYNRAHFPPRGCSWKVLSNHSKVKLEMQVGILLFMSLALCMFGTEVPLEILGAPLMLTEAEGKMKEACSGRYHRAAISRSWTPLATGFLSFEIINPWCSTVFSWEF